jgi:hypothetical protein
LLYQFSLRAALDHSELDHFPLQRATQVIRGLHEQCRTTLSRRFKVEWLLYTPALWHFTLDPSRCIKLGASFKIPPVAQMNAAGDRLSRIVANLRDSGLKTNDRINA